MLIILCRLLARCSELLKCTSAVGEFAVYFNPELRCTDMNVKLRHTPEGPPLPQHASVNPTQRNKIAFQNTHGRALWPWNTLLASRWLPRRLVLWAWGLCAVPLRLGLRHVSA